MTKPLVVSIPHRLGKEEATRRLRAGLGRVRSDFGQLMAIDRENWSGDHLDFQVRAVGQTASGTIDVADDHVRVEVVLPWLLGVLAERLAPMIRKEGTLMLEKK